MKKIAILLVLGVLLTVSCEKKEQKPQVSKVTFTPCKQEVLQSSKSSGNVEVEFTGNGVQIKYYNFEVSCDFTTVNVTHTFVNGVLNITQQGFPNEADCICYTDVSYTISGILQKEVNVIFINGIQVYCHNGNPSNCDQDVIISQTEYENAPNSPVFIDDMKIVDHCLKIKFSSSGCDGKSWVVKLIDSGEVIPTFAPPPMRMLRLSLDNKEMCDALITKEISFNIEDLQITGKSVMLNINGKHILYEY